MFATLIGAVLGLKSGGVIGMIFGGLLGYYIQALIFNPQSLLGGSSRRELIQKEYFKALFICLGKIAKADGVVTRDEIDRCELIIQKMNLNSSQRKQAIEFFSLGKQQDMDLSGPLNQLNSAATGSFAVKQTFMETLLEVAVSRNQIIKSEWLVMLQICQHLRFSQQVFIAIARMRGFDVGGSQSNSYSHSQQRNWPRKPALQNSYQTLGVNPADSKTVIRKAYKKLMSTHHPDKLIAKGVPPDMVNVAKEKTQDIQKAWEDIKRQRGF